MRFGSNIGAEDARSGENQIAIGVRFGCREGDVAILPCYPRRPFQPGTGINRAHKVTDYTHRDPAQFGVVPNCGGQQAIGKGCHHSPMQAAMGVAMTVQHTQPMPELVIYNLVKVGSIMGCIRAAMARMNKARRWISLFYNSIFVFHWAIMMCFPGKGEQRCRTTMNLILRLILAPNGSMVRLQQNNVLKLRSIYAQCHRVNFS